MQDSPGRAEDRIEDLDRTRLRIEELRRRAAELEERNLELARHERPGDSGLDHVQRAADRADAALAKAQEAERRAANASRRSAAAHESAALRHEQLAGAGVGDVEEHRRRAREHHAMSRADLQEGSSRWPAQSSDPAAAPRDEPTGEV